MDKLKILKELKARYPDAKIILDSESNPKEIIAEIEPGRAVVVIDESKPHYHRITNERYLILDGCLSLYVDGERIKLKKGEIYDIEPGQAHHATGNEAWVEALSNPPWTKDDHFYLD